MPDWFKESDLLTASSLSLSVDKFNELEVPEGGEDGSGKVDLSPESGGGGELAGLNGSPFGGGGGGVTPPGDVPVA